MLYFLFLILITSAAPKIKKKLENMSISADDTLKLTIEVEGLPKPSVLFYKDGQEIKKTDRIKVVEEGVKHTLVIEKTNLKDTGKYKIRYIVKIYFTVFL